MCACASCLQKFGVRRGDDGIVARLPWLQLSVSPQQAKALAEFKPPATSRGGVTATACRFCECDIEGGLSGAPPAGPGLERVCASPDCVQLAAQSCVRVLGCGHLCGGVRGEAVCPPCYEGCGGPAADGDAYCGVCYSDALRRQPAISLSCGHTFHAACVTQYISAGYSGPAISFSFLGCPLCRVCFTSHAAVAPSL